MQGICIVYIHVPPSCNDRLQPMDLTVQTSSRTYLKSVFKNDMQIKISKQLEYGEIDKTLTHIDLRLAFLKPLSAEWLVQVHADIKSVKKLIYWGLRRAGSLKRSDTRSHHLNCDIVSGDYSYMYGVFKTAFLSNGFGYRYILFLVWHLNNFKKLAICMLCMNTNILQQYFVLN